MRLQLPVGRRSPSIRVQPVLLVLAASQVQNAAAIGYFDYNATTGVEVNSNLRLFPDEERVASGYRFSSSPVLGYESESRAWSISPIFNVQRFGNDDFGDQNFFSVNAQGRYDWTQRLTTSLQTNYQTDSNFQVSVEDPDPTIVLSQVPLERESRQVSGTVSYQWSERFSSNVSGSYFEQEFASVSGANAPAPEFNTRSLNFGSNYVLTEQLSLNASVGLSDFETGDGARRNNDRFFNGGVTYSPSENWRLSGSAGLRETQQTFRVFLPGRVFPGPIVSNIPIRPELEGTFSPELDAIFGLPVIISGGRARLRLQELVPGSQTQNTVSNTYDFSVSRIFSRGSVTFGFSRFIQPAGIQAQLDSESLSGSAFYRFSERMSSTLIYRDISQVIQGQQPGSGGFNNRTISATLTYQLTRKHSLTGGYSYRESSAPGIGFAPADAHVVTLSVSYNGDRLEW